MLSKSFKSLRICTKRAHIKFDQPSLILQHPKYNIDPNYITFKRQYCFSSNFDESKANFKRHFESTFNDTDAAQFDTNRLTSIKKPKSLPLSQELKSLAKQLQSQPSYFIAPLYHTKTYQYASFLLTAVRLLNERQAFSDSNVLKTYFRQIKNSINSVNTKVFTPKSALKLLQEFSMIDFDGDESISLDKILDYVEKNFNQFEQVNLEELKIAYKDIMVNKAFGPVKFRPLNLPKSYKSQIQRKTSLVKQKILQKLKLSLPESQKQLSLQAHHTKKWFSIKLPSKNIYFLSYPNSLESLALDEIYLYIFDMKQLISASMAKNSIMKSPKSIKVDMLQFVQNQSQSDYQTFIQQGIVFQKKIQIIDEIQKIKEMRKMSLQEQIQRMNEKKKALKQKEKEKSKGKEAIIPKEQKQMLGQTKKLNFIKTLNYHLDALNKELIQKINKRNKEKVKLTRKQRKMKQKNMKPKLQQEDQDQEQEEQADQQYQEDQFQSQQKQDLSIYKNDPLKLQSEFKDKMQEYLEQYKMKMAVIKGKEAEKKQKKNPVQLTEVLTINHNRENVKSMIQRISNKHNIKQLKEFAGYIGLVELLSKAIRQIEKDMILERNANLKKELLAKQSNKLSSSLGFRFALVQNQLNEPLDTNVNIDMKFDEVFEKLTQKSIENMDTPRIFIMPESQLLNWYADCQKSTGKSMQKNNKMDPAGQDQSLQDIEEKRKILDLIFKHQGQK